jgi:hypothetical protein
MMKTKDTLQDYFTNVKLVEVTDKAEVLSQINSKCSACWGAGQVLGDSEYTALGSPSKHHKEDVRVQYYCANSLIED